MAEFKYGDVSLERMVRAVEKVRERLLRIASALEKSGIPYAVAGGNAVAAWVSRVDEAAVRNTQDVGILVRRADLKKITGTLEKAGFIFKHVAGVDLFLDGPKAKARDAVHLVFAGEKVKVDYLMPAPEVTHSEPTPYFQVLTLEALVQMKLTSFRDQDRTHRRDLLEVGLVNQSWCSRFPKEMGARLKKLIDNPEG